MLTERQEMHSPSSWTPRPAFTVENGETMILDVESSIGEYHDKHLMELISSVLTSF